MRYMYGKHPAVSKLQIEVCMPVLVAQPETLLLACLQLPRDVTIRSLDCEGLSATQ